MKDKRKLAVLGLLRELHDQGVHPTLRQCGLTETESQELAIAELVVVGDTGVGSGLDRYVIYELTAEAVVWLTQQKGPLQRHVVTHTPAQSAGGKIVAALGKRLWDMLWDAVKIAVGVAAGWWLKKHFP